MTLKVSTINPRTGEAGELVVATDDALEAERLARLQGLWVDTIKIPGSAAVKAASPTSVMKWRVLGAHRDDGKDVEIVVECPTPSGAEERARQLGLYVSSIVPVIAAAPASTAVSNNDHGVRVKAGRPVMVEMTSKAHKRQMLIGMIIFGSGVVLCFTIIGIPLGAPAMVVGIVYFVIARICAWWDHG